MTVWKIFAFIDYEIVDNQITEDPNDPDYNPDEDLENLEENLGSLEDTEAHTDIKVEETKNFVQPNISQIQKVKKSPKKKSLEDELNAFLNVKEPNLLGYPRINKKPTTLSELLEGLDKTKFVCYFCDKVFENKKYLHTHQMKHQDSNGNFPCR